MNKSPAEAQGRREKAFLSLRLSVTAGNFILYKEKKTESHLEKNSIFIYL
jgi:hypothetical protein